MPCEPAGRAGSCRRRVHDPQRRRWLPTQRTDAGPGPAAEVACGTASRPWRAARCRRGDCGVPAGPSRSTIVATQRASSARDIRAGHQHDRAVALAVGADGAPPPGAAADLDVGTVGRRRRADRRGSGSSMSREASRGVRRLRARRRCDGRTSRVRSPILKISRRTFFVHRRGTTFLQVTARCERLSPDSSPGPCTGRPQGHAAPSPGRPQPVHRQRPRRVDALPTGAPTSRPSRPPG